MRKNKFFTEISWLGDFKIISFFGDDDKYVYGFFAKTLNRPEPRYTKRRRPAHSNEIFLIRIKNYEDKKRNNSL